MAEKKEEGTPGKFWGVQPVAQSKQQLLTGETEKPIDPPKTQEDIRQIPLQLPKDFSWYEVDIDNPEEVCFS
jgi:hypothetical protein